MLKTYILPLLALMVMANGCKKSTQDFSGAKVNSAINYLGQFTLTYTYNANGDVELVQQSDGAKTTYQYAGDTVSVLEYTSTGVAIRGNKYMLFGLYADSSVGLLQAQNVTSKYVYDGTGILARSKTYGSGTLLSEVEYTISNKNVALLTATNVLNNTYTKTYFAYDANRSTSIGNQNQGMGFLGVSSTNIPVKEVQLNQAGDTLSIKTYRYTYDDQSRIATKSAYDRNGVQIDSMAYTYY